MYPYPRRAREEKNFPEDSNKPAVGLGRRPHERGFTVIAHQLVEETCSHLGEAECRIHNRRPASYRQFPFSLKETPKAGSK